MDIEEQIKIIERGTLEIISKEELIEKLKKKKKLTVKLGVDPSTKDLHLGHTVVINKLADFQKLGHETIFVIGDKTGIIGDPSGQSSTRRMLTKEEIEENVKTYKNQLFKILDPSKTKVVYNSSWFNKMTFNEIIQLLSKYTVARMLERDDFNERFKLGNPISIVEFVYPLMQAYDSVILNADVEIGASDQKFNFMVTRAIQKDYNQEPEVAITMPILIGTDGIRKMSKSYKNTIELNLSPIDMFGKIMSIPDSIMESYFTLLTSIEYDKNMHPKELKKILARDITSKYHGEENAKMAEEEFEKIFEKKSMPDNVPIKKISKNELKDGKIWVVKLLLLTNLAKSRSEAERLIRQKAIKVNNQLIITPNCDINISNETIVKCGKRKFIKVEFNG
jgi:tyrosyl-tRNA synthetase